MTVAKASRFQDDLRTLFRKYGITSGIALFMHDKTLHPIEVHVTEKNELVVSLMNALAEATKAGSDVPVWEHWNTDDN